MAVRLPLACLALLAPAPAAAQPASSPVQAMVDDVFASGSDAEIAAVVKYARRTAPELAEALDRRLAARVAERSAAEQARLANPVPLANWSGRGGPAFRHAEPVNGPDEDGFSGRGALDARWQLGPGLKVTQTDAAFLDSRGNTFSATTGLEAQLFGPVAARLSYNVQYESQPSAGRVGTDTLGRITLVYGF